MACQTKIVKILLASASTLLLISCAVLTISTFLTIGQINTDRQEFLNNPDKENLTNYCTKSDINGYSNWKFFSPWQNCKRTGFYHDDNINCTYGGITYPTEDPVWVAVEFDKINTIQMFNIQLVLAVGVCAVLGLLAILYGSILRVMLIVLCVVVGIFLGLSVDTLFSVNRVECLQKEYGPVLMVQICATIAIILFMVLEAGFILILLWCEAAETYRNGTQSTENYGRLEEESDPIVEDHPARTFKSIVLASLTPLPNVRWLMTIFVVNTVICVPAFIMQAMICSSKTVCYNCRQLFHLCRTEVHVLLLITYICSFLIGIAAHGLSLQLRKDQINESYKKRASIGYYIAVLFTIGLGFVPMCLVRYFDFRNEEFMTAVIITQGVWLLCSFFYLGLWPIRALLCSLWHYILQPILNGCYTFCLLPCLRSVALRLIEDLQLNQMNRQNQQTEQSEQLEPEPQVENEEISSQPQEN